MIAYTVVEAARVASVSADTIRRAIHTSETGGPVPPLTAKKVGAKYVIPAENLADWITRLPDA